jgi:pimeloyl-ACP methyl ester carboxylesterase
VIRDTEATREGCVERDGVAVHYQVFGRGEPALLLLPTWSIVHADFWRNQVAHFSSRATVVVFDGRGNGATGSPEPVDAYDVRAFAADAIAVLDDVRVEAVATLSVSRGAGWQLLLAAEHADRITAAVFIAPSLPLGEPLPDRARSFARFDEPQEHYEGWLKFNRHYWQRDWPDFLEFFFSRCFTEPGSEREIAHFVSMGLETTPEVIAKTIDAPGLTGAEVESLARAVACPVLVIHGENDAISSVKCGRELAALTDAELVVMPGVGHEPQCRWPRETNQMLDAFLARTVAPQWAVQ